MKAIKEAIENLRGKVTGEGVIMNNEEWRDYGKEKRN